MQNLPVIGWASQHPRIAAWLVLSIGIVAMVMIEGRDVGLLPGQWVAIIVASVLVSGACIWIVSWEDDNEEEAETTNADASKTEEAA